MHSARSTKDVFEGKKNGGKPPKVALRGQMSDLVTYPFVKV